MTDRAGSAPPRVSVGIITYNHARFLGQAIESVLAQRTDFAYEIVIGDDGSTDGTREIALAYQRRYPDRIRVITSPANVGIQRNAKRVVDACRGDYVAALEGDDYWIDDRKLQLQVERLDREPDAIICGARAEIWKDGDAAPHGIAPRERSDELSTYGIHELFTGQWWFRTCTKMWPRRMIEAIPARYQGDWEGLLWLIARHPSGKVCFLDRVVAVYREHAGGVWSSSTLARRGLSDVRILYHAVPWFRGDQRRYLQTRMLATMSAVVRDGSQPRRRLIIGAAMCVRRNPLSVRAWRVVARALGLPIAVPD